MNIPSAHIIKKMTKRVHSIGYLLSDLLLSNKYHPAWLSTEKWKFLLGEIMMCLIMFVKVKFWADVKSAEKKLRNALNEGLMKKMDKL